MRICRTHILSFLIALLFALPATAAHIIGGEISYRCLGSNNYEIKIKVYRDCASSGAPYDNPLHLGIFNSAGALLMEEDITFPGSAPVPIVSPDPCLVVPPGICVEEAVYTKVLNLPPIVGGYTLTYQRCCRNSTILNLTTPGSQGSTYTIRIPGIETGITCNSSPAYNKFPPIFLCINTPFTFDHSATDIDGDSLVYELCAPFNGGSTTAPMPSPPSPPPYGFVSYTAGYSSGYPIASSPAISINRFTGLITMKPTLVGQFVVGVCCTEYRGGVAISTNKRDFQFNVVNCNNVIAAIPTQTVFCKGLTVNFSSAGSINATSFEWDFGDPTTTTDVSFLPNPTYTYADSGVYRVRLIARSSTGACVDTVYSTFRVYPLLAPDFVPPTGQCVNQQSFSFAAGGSYDTPATFQWKFLPDGIPATSTAKNPTGIKFATPGPKTVRLIISQYLCKDSVSKTINVWPLPKPLIGDREVICGDMEIDFQNLSTGATSYTWDFGVPGTTTDVSNLFEPDYLYADSGVYNVRLVAIDANGCRDTTRKNFRVYPRAKPDFVVPPKQCIRGNSFNFLAGGIFSTNALFRWEFENGLYDFTTAKNPAAMIFTDPGDNDVKFIVYQYGCADSIIKQVRVVSLPVASITPVNQYCVGKTVDFVNGSSNYTSSNWDFGVPGISTDVSTLNNPTYTYADTGQYTITLIAWNEGVCTDTATERYYVYPLLKPLFAKPPDDCVIGNKYNFTALGSFGTRNVFEWNFSSVAVPTNSALQNPTAISYTRTGTFPITLTYKENGCTRSFTDSVKIFPMPYAGFTASPLQGCTPLPVNFTDTSFAATPITYLWKFGDGSTSTDKDPLHVYQDSGKFDVSLRIITTSGCRDTVEVKKPKLIYAAETPTAGFSLTPEETSIFEPLIRFTDTSSPFKVKCILEFGNGVYTDSCNYSYAYPDTGLYEVKQVVYNALGCTDTVMHRVRILPEYRFWVPNAFSPNDDGYNDIFNAVTIGVKEFEMRIFDRWGELIFETKDKDLGWDGKIKGNPCQQDVYVYEINIRSVFRKRYNFRGNFTLVR